MNLVLIGALLGGLAGAGLLMAILAAPPLRRPTLSDRIAPYLTDAAKPSRLLTGSATGGTVTALGRMTAPLVRDAVRFIDKVLGGPPSPADWPRWIHGSPSISSGPSRCCGVPPARRQAPGSACWPCSWVSPIP